MKVFICIPLCILSLSLLSGCWGKYELSQWAFVQAVAIDQTKDQKIKMTTLFYKPNGSGNSGKNEKDISAIMISTQGDTVFEAVRDIPIHLGRKAHWGHMRTIVIGEETSKTNNLGKLLDFFVRDYEPWGNTTITVAKGNAEDYLKVKPLIEGTIAQQLRQADKAAARYSSKTTELNLLQLMVQMKGEVGVVMVPYIYLSKNALPTIPIAGVVFIKDTKMVDGVIDSKKVQNLLILTNHYHGGVIKFSCQGDSETNKTKESFEVASIKTLLKPRIKGDSLSVQVEVKIEGYVGELHCSSTDTSEKTDAVESIIEKTVEQNLRSVVQYLQKQKMDALGIGNQIYRKDPALWEVWKKDWDNRFAEASFEIKTDVSIRNSGMEIGKPYSRR